jgi:hypothetical protein
MGKLFFQHNYKYHQNGKIKENLLIDADGNSRINYYDKKGNSLTQ